MPLNINLQQILLHALNFVILFGALYFLLYKPVRDAAASEHERVMEQARGEIAELMSAAAEKLVLSSTSDAYDKFLDTAEERKNNG